MPDTLRNGTHEKDKERGRERRRDGGSNEEECMVNISSEHSRTNEHACLKGLIL